MGTQSSYPNSGDLLSDLDLDDFADEESDEESDEINEAASTGKVVSLLPVHAAPHVGGKSKGSSLTIGRQRGRPRKVERMPTTTDLEYHARMSETKAKFVDTDAVVQAAVKHADPMAMLSVIKTEVAKESAALHFQRIESEKYGRDTAQVSSRRIDALKKIADIELEVKKLGGDTVDVNSEKMQRIFKFFIDTVRESLQASLTPEMLDVVFNRLSTDFDGWQEKLSNVLR